MRSLKGSAEEKQLVQRYVKQLDDQENQIAALRADEQKLRADRDRLAKELTDLVEKVGT